MAGVPMQPTAWMVVTDSMSTRDGSACWNPCWVRNTKYLRKECRGSNTVFPDPIYEENFCGIDVLAPILMTHQPVDLLIIMLGTNDCRDMFNANPDLIARGMERLA